MLHIHREHGDDERKQQKQQNADQRDLPEPVEKDPRPARRRMVPERIAVIRRQQRNRRLHMRRNRPFELHQPYERLFRGIPVTSGTERHQNQGTSLLRQTLERILRFLRKLLQSLVPVAQFNHSAAEIQIPAQCLHVCGVFRMLFHLHLRIFRHNGRFATHIGKAGGLISQQSAGIIDNMHADSGQIRLFKRIAPQTHDRGKRAQPGFQFGIFMLQIIFHCRPRPS